MKKAEREIVYLKRLIRNIENQILKIEETKLKNNSIKISLYEWLEENKHLKDKTQTHNRLFNCLKTFVKYDTDINITKIFEIKGEYIYKIRGIGRQTGDLFNELVENIN